VSKKKPTLADPCQRRPLPQVGDRIVLRYQADNPNNWPEPGVVRAVVDDEAIVVRRTSPRYGAVYELIDAIRWHVFMPDKHGHGLVLLPREVADWVAPAKALREEDPNLRAMNLEDCPSARAMRKLKEGGQELTLEDWKALGAPDDFGQPTSPAKAPTPAPAPAPAPSSEPSLQPWDDQASRDLVLITKEIYVRKYRMRRALAVVAGRSWEQIEAEEIKARERFADSNMTDVTEPEWMADPLPAWMAEAERHVDARFKEECARGLLDPHAILEDLLCNPEMWSPGTVRGRVSAKRKGNT
jgi:hypothetical protein